MKITPSKIDSYKLCPRRYAFRYVDNVSDETRSTTRGRNMHQLVEPVLKRGEELPTKCEDPVALESLQMGQQYWPVVGEDDPIWVEQWINFSYGGHVYSGNADLIWEASTFPVVSDHKFTKSLRWKMSPGELRKDVAATIYAYGAFKKFESAEEIMLRWLYYVITNVDKPQYQEKAQCKAVTVMVDREEVKSNMREINEVVDNIAEDTEKASALDVDADTGGCSAYGGCPYKTRCYGGGDVPLGRKTAGSW